MEAIQTDYRTARLSEADRGMLDFVEKLTRSPGKMVAEDVATLRTLGFDDATVLDIVQITALFAYFNRLADGLGIEMEAAENPRQAAFQARMHGGRE